MILWSSVVRTRRSVHLIYRRWCRPVSSWGYHWLRGRPKGPDVLGHHNQHYSRIPVSPTASVLASCCQSGATKKYIPRVLDRDPQPRLQRGETGPFLLTQDDRSPVHIVRDIRTETTSPDSTQGWSRMVMHVYHELKRGGFHCKPADLQPPSGDLRNGRVGFVGLHRPLGLSQVSVSVGWQSRCFPDRGERTHPNHFSCSGVGLNWGTNLSYAVVTIKQKPGP